MQPDVYFECIPVAEASVRSTVTYPVSKLVYHFACKRSLCLTFILRKNRQAVGRAR